MLFNMHFADPNVWNSNVVSQINSTEQIENYTKSDGTKYTEYKKIR